MKCRVCKHEVTNVGRLTRVHVAHHCCSEECFQLMLPTALRAEEDYLSLAAADEIERLRKLLADLVEAAEPLRWNSLSAGEHARFAVTLDAAKQSG